MKLIVSMRQIQLHRNLTHFGIQNARTFSSHSLAEGHSTLGHFLASQLLSNRVVNFIGFVVAVDFLLQITLLSLPDGKHRSFRKLAQTLVFHEVGVRPNIASRPRLLVQNTFPRLFSSDPDCVAGRSFELESVHFLEVVDGAWVLVAQVARKPRGDCKFDLLRVLVSAFLGEHGIESAILLTVMIIVG